MLSALLASVAMGALVCAGLYFSTHVVAAWYCFLVSCAINAYLGSNQASIGGFHLDATDAVGLALMIAGVLRLSRRDAPRGVMRFVALAFFAVLAFSLARGLVSNGLLAAGVDARGYLTEILSLLYFFTIPTDEETIGRLVKGYLVYGGVLAVAVLLHYLGFSVGDAAAAVDSEGRDRALTVAGATTLAICCLLSLAWIVHRSGSSALRIVPAVCAGLVLILQHRTAWNILFGCAAVLPFVDLRMGRRFATAASLAAILTVPLAIGIYGSGAGASEILETSATNANTWDYRVEQWAAFLADPGQTRLTVLLGAPLGTPYLHYVGTFGTFDDVGPHSEYVALYTRFGVVGAALFVCFMLYPLAVLYRRSRTARQATFPSTSSWFLIVLCTVIYGVTYKLEPSIGVFLGIANALALRPETQP